MAEHQLPSRLGDEFCVHRDGALRPVLEPFESSLVVLLLREEAVFEHAVDDVELAHGRALRVGDRVVGRGCLRQAGQHGCLGGRQRLERLAKVDLARGREAVGALPEIDLVHVELEDAVLRQRAFDLQREQDFVNLACERFFRRKVKVARYLHRDGRCALAARFANVGQPCA
jgi:hypothetical protein